MYIKPLFFLIIVLVIFSCSQEPIDSFKPKSLLEYGIPVTVSVPNPDSVVVNKDEMGPFLDITVDGGDGYFLQIYASPAETNDVSKIKSEQLNQVKDQPYFSRVISEEPQGFIFENMIDSTSSFGFRYIMVKGDKEIIIRNHLSRLFKQEEIELMYEAVKPKEK